MPEDRLVAIALRVIRELLPRRMEVERGAALLYQIKLDNRLNLTVDPKAPTRGQSAFQTDICVFERIAVNLRIPRVVLEFKPGLSTHDVLTYSTKARKHKQVYPYLRYGVLTSRERYVAGKFFTHNEALDFCLATGGLSRTALRALLRSVLKKEVSASRRLESIAFGSTRARLYRTEVCIGGV
jgi:hypothetical protein